MEKLKLGIDDIAAATGENRSNIMKAVKLGHLRTFIVGRRRFARPDAVRKWIDFLEAQSDKGRVVRYQAKDVANRPARVRA